MSETDRFPSHVVSQMERGFGEKRASEKEFHMPHPHALSPFQKFITVVELIFFGWVIYLLFKTAVNNVMHLGRVM